MSVIRTLASSLVAVFSSEHLAEHWRRLDQFEGDGYARVLTTAKLTDGTAVGAYVYTLCGSR